jgi:hypothetical protein
LTLASIREASIRITPWSKNGKSGWEVDFWITWPDGGRFRARKTSPFSAHDYRSLSMVGGDDGWEPYRCSGGERESDQG